MQEPLDDQSRREAGAGMTGDVVDYPGAVDASPDELDVITQADLDAEKSRSSRARARRQREAEARKKAAKKSEGDGVAGVFGGFGAIRQVRDASRRHADARDKVKSLKSELDQSQKVLDHRLSIERDYPRIVSKQTETIETQRKASERASAEISRLEDEHSDLQGQLDEMKKIHEEQLRPYRELMESTKGRADDAAKALADAKRLAKAADQQVSDATKRRDQSIASANRSVDNSTERLHKAEAELDALKSDPNAATSVVQKKQSDIVSEKAHLDAARAELERATSEGKRLVDNAQSNLVAQRRALETAEGTADATKHEADAHREEYERLYNKAQDEEKGLSDAIAKRERGIASLKKERAEAEDGAAAAQKVLDEANDVHANPEVTIELRKTIDQGKEELKERQRTAQRLARDEKSLRAATRKQRYLFVGIVALLVVVVVVVLFMVLGGR